MANLEALVVFSCGLLVAGPWGCSSPRSMPDASAGDVAPPTDSNAADVVTGDTSTGSCPGPQCVVQLAALYSGMCVRRTNGAVVCWGGNASADLGNGGTMDSPPTAVVGLTDATALFRGCATRTNGALVCWGPDYGGQLADGTTTNATIPIVVAGLGDAVELTIGADFACARKTSGAVVCWGSNGLGTVGDGTSVNRATPTPVIGLTDAIAISAGGQGACAIRRSGAVVCWGRDEIGQLGDGTTTTMQTAPVAVVGLTDATQISMAGSHGCAVRRGGSVACWGQGVNGELGNGAMANAASPVVVSGLTDAVEVQAASDSTCARRANGSIVCWGNGLHDQLGTDPNTTPFSTVPVPVPGV